MVGLTAVLWHMASWIAIGFVVVLLASLAVLGPALRTVGPRKPQP